MPDARPFLVYRDRIGTPSEIGFLRRQYIGFTRLSPIWIGRFLLPGAEQIGPNRLRVGGNGPLGPLRRMLFRHFGRAPQLAIPGLAPVLHAQFARGGVLALPLAEAFGLRLFVTLHGGDIAKRKNWQRTVLSYRWPTLLRRAERFICVSHAVADTARARGVPDAKLTVLPIGVEIPATPPPRQPSCHLFVGRFVEKKGITVLAEAMHRLRAQGDATPLLCVGDGPMRPVLEALSRELPGICLAGWLPPEAVRARMADAVSLLVPSVIAADGDAEGLPSVIPEAMAQSCPVIGSDQGGIAEAIRHEATGLLVPPGDAGSLAAAMRRLSTDTSFAATLGAAGYAHAAAELNARTQSALLEALLIGR